MEKDVKEKPQFYVGNIDIIRFFAATSIVFHHYQQIACIRFNGLNFYGGSFNFAYFVEMFFIISGFLTEYTFRKNEKLKKWFINKVTRYYPYAMIACIVSLITAVFYYKITGIQLFGMNYDGPTIITSLLLVHQGWIKEYVPAINNPTWYLCVLTICYLLYWIVRNVCENSKIKRIWGFYFIILIALQLYYMNSSSGFNAPFLYRGDIRGYGSFFLGAVMCFYYNRLSKKALGDLTIRKSRDFD